MNGRLLDGPISAHTVEGDDAGCVVPFRPPSGKQVIGRAAAEPAPLVRLLVLLYVLAKPRIWAWVGWSALLGHYELGRSDLQGRRHVISVRRLGRGNRWCLGSSTRDGSGIGVNPVVDLLRHCSCCGGCYKEVQDHRAAVICLKLARTKVTCEENGYGEVLLVIGAAAGAGGGGRR